MNSSETLPHDEPSAGAAGHVPTTMRAWTQDRFGGADVLRLSETDTPRPEGDQVLVRLASTSMNAADRYMVTCPALAMRPMFGIRRPKQHVPGLDVAGTVVAVGDRVSRLRVGDRVIGEAHGAWAEYAVTTEANVAIAPSAIDLADAGALPVAGLTALQGLRDHGRVTDGSRVLVYGATGSVGAFAVQIAAALGGEVTAVCGADAAELVGSLGAREVVDRADGPDGDPAARLLADGRRFDVLFDVAGVVSTRRRARLLADDGVCVIVGAPSGGSILGPIRPLIATMIAGRFVRGRFVNYVAKADADDLAELGRLVDEGDLRPVVDERFPFERLPDAFERFVSASKRGKLVVEMPGAA